MRYAIVCGLLFSIGATSAAADEAAERTKIQAARDQWMEAFFKGDTETMDHLEADEFNVIAGNVIADKKNQLARIKESVEGGDGFPPGVMSVNVDVKIRFAGKDVAIVSGHVANKFPGEDAPRMRFAITEVWQRTDDEWRVLHLHFHPIELVDESQR